MGTQSPGERSPASAQAELLALAWQQSGTQLPWCSTILKACAENGTARRRCEGTTDLTLPKLFSRGTWVSVLQLLGRLQHQWPPKESKILTHLCSGDNPCHTPWCTVILSLLLLLWLPPSPYPHVPPSPLHISNKIIPIPPLLAHRSHWNVTTVSFWSSLAHAFPSIFLHNWFIYFS